MEYLLYAILGLLLLLNVLFIYLASRVAAFRYNKPEEEGDRIEELPAITFLIAARNEEKNIERCISSILKQNYPKDKIQIIVGDDDSEDNTAKILKQFDEVQVEVITKNVSGLVGKSNVLAQIAKHATGTYLAFTDADIALNKEWARNMVAQFDNGHIGIVSGVTMVEGSAFQNMDWIMALGMVKTVSDFNIPVTGIGNNMMIPRRVYEDIGGYEAVGRSIIEDYAIFQRIIDKYSFKNLFYKEVLAHSRPIKGFFNILMQRKRWMKGAVQLPFPIRSILILQAAFFPLIALVGFIDINTMGMLWVAKLFFQSVYLTRLFIKLNLKIRFLDLLWYECYSTFLSVSLMLFYILPIKVKWKGRSY